MERLTDDELAVIERRAEAASKAPWLPFIGGGLGGPSFIRVGGLDDNEADMYVMRDQAVASDADLDFIAHAREDVPRLLQEVRELSRNRPS